MNRSYQLQAFGLAFVLETALLAGAAYALTATSMTKPMLSGSEYISLVNEGMQPAKPPTRKHVVPKLLTPKPPEPTQQVVSEPPKPEIPQVAEAQANAFTEPAPPPPRAVAGMAEPSAEFAAKVHAAVQAATYYPPAASSLRYAGRVRVEFHLLDKVPSAIRLLVASGIGMIDRAALHAVQDAQYPDSPPELRGSDHVYQVWVEFNANQ